MNGTMYHGTLQTCNRVTPYCTTVQCSSARLCTVNAVSGGALAVDGHQVGVRQLDRKWINFEVVMVKKKNNLCCEKEESTVTNIKIISLLSAM